LVALLSPLILVEPKWQRLHAELAALTDAAVEFRYPNRWAGSADAREAYAVCRRLRAMARVSLGLKP
jgi:hypothetical protein